MKWTRHLKLLVPLMLVLVEEQFEQFQEMFSEHDFFKNRIKIVNFVSKQREFNQVQIGILSPISEALIGATSAEIWKTTIGMSILVLG
jgi:hypothetical protein